MRGLAVESAARVSGVSVSDFAVQECSGLRGFGFGVQGLGFHV